jgi:hypothetical protein
VVTVEDRDDLQTAAAALEPYADGSPSLEPEGPQVIVPVRPGTRLTEAVRALDAAGADAVDVSRREATLDDVFLSLTDPRRRKEAQAA